MHSQSPGRGEGALAALEQLDRAQRPNAPQRPTPVGRSNRRSIRRRGPLLALVLPALIGASGLALLRGNESTARGVGGFVLVVLAAPLLTVAGVPLRSGTSVYAVAGAASVVLWCGLGAVAARRATRGTIATWTGFWGEYMVLLLAAWAGTVLALVGANLVLGRSLI